MLLVTPVGWLDAVHMIKWLFQTDPHIYENVGDILNFIVLMLLFQIFLVIKNEYYSLHIILYCHTFTHFLSSNPESV